MTSHLLLVFGMLIVIGTFASKISTKWGVPVLLIFLAIGMIAGSDGLNLIDMSNYTLARDIANIALIFILFDSGFNTKRSHLKKYFGPSLLLATGGIIVTAASLGVLIHFLLNLQWLHALLLGSIISSTDAAAVMTILRERPVKTHVSSTLEIESAANDPMAILLTLFMINLIQNAGSAGFQDYCIFIGQLLWQFAGGILTAKAISIAAGWLFNHFENDNQSLFYVLYMGIALVTYGTADTIGANGTIAIFFCGYWLGNSDFVFKRGVSHFIGGISTLANMCVFLLLGLLVFPSSMVKVWQQGILLAVALAGGIGLLLRTGLPLLYIGLAGAACSVFYPFLKYHALGDFVIFAAYAFLPMLGTVYVCTLDFDWSVLYLAVPVGFITVAILHCNNTRDMDTDRRADISTIAMRLGGRVSVWLYCIEILLPYVWLTVCAVAGLFPLWTLLVWLTVIPAIMNVRTAVSYFSDGSGAIARLDEATARLQLLFSLVLGVSFVIAGLLG